MTYPVFAASDILYASDMNAVGLWKVNDATATFTGGTAGSVTNGTVTVGTNNTAVTVTCFSATFDNYKILYSGGTGSGNIDFELQIGAAVTAYHYSSVYSPWNNTPTALGSTTGTFFPYAGGATTTWASAEFELSSPFATTRTMYRAQASNFAAGINTVGFLNNATSYTAFTLRCSAGNITGGTIRVYGYRN